MLNRSLKTTSRHQAGVGLIDILVAVFIFSVGILAITALQFLSKQSNFEAIQRSNAALLAYEMFEKMRMNSLYISSSTAPLAPTVSTLSYYVPSGTTVIDQSNPGSKPTPDCSLAICTQEQLADWDMYEFQQMMLGSAETDTDDDTINLGGLVNPTACIAGPSTGDSVYTITIAWRGQAKINNKDASTCGAGTGLYDDAAADDFAYRRLVRITSYLH